MDQQSFRALIASAASTRPTSAPAPAPASTAAPPKPRWQPRPKPKPKAAVDGPAAPAYQDRAAARRKAGNVEDVAAGLDYAQSKYMGGDLAHTHLVKGLDFALLDKMRRSLEAEEDGALDAALDGGGGAPSGATASAAAASAPPPPAPSVTRWAAQVVQRALLAHPVMADDDAEGGITRGRGGGGLSTSAHKDVARLLSGEALGGSSTLNSRSSGGDMGMTRFKGGRTSFKCVLGMPPLLDMTPFEVPETLLRSEEDVESEAPALVDRLDPTLLARVAAIMRGVSVGSHKGVGGKAHRRERERAPSGSAEKKLLNSAPTAAAPRGGGMPHKPAAAAGAAAGSGANADNDDDDIFGGVGAYIPPDVAASSVAGTAATAAAALIPDAPSAARVGGGRWGVAVHTVSDGSTPAAGFSRVGGGASRFDAPHATPGASAARAHELHGDIAMGTPAHQPLALHPQQQQPQSVAPPPAAGGSGFTGTYASFVASGKAGSGGATADVAAAIRYAALAAQFHAASAAARAQGQQLHVASAPAPMAAFTAPPAPALPPPSPSMPPPPPRPPRATGSAAAVATVVAAVPAAALAIIPEGRAPSTVAPYLRLRPSEIGGAGRNEDGTERFDADAEAVLGEWDEMEERGEETRAKQARNVAAEGLREEIYGSVVEEVVPAPPPPPPAPVTARGGAPAPFYARRDAASDPLGKGGIQGGIQGDVSSYADGPAGGGAAGAGALIDKRVYARTAYVEEEEEEGEGEGGADAFALELSRRAGTGAVAGGGARAGAPGASVARDAFAFAGLGAAPLNKKAQRQAKRKQPLEGAPGGGGAPHAGGAPPPSSGGGGGGAASAGRGVDADLAALRAGDLSMLGGGSTAPVVGGARWGGVGRGGAAGGAPRGERGGSSWNAARAAGGDDDEAGAGGAKAEARKRQKMDLELEKITSRIETSKGEGVRLTAPAPPKVGSGSSILPQW